LSHTELCGRDELDDTIVHDKGLRVDRRSVFARTDFCAPVVRRENPPVLDHSTGIEVTDSTTVPVPPETTATTATTTTTTHSKSPGKAGDASWIKQQKTTTTTVSSVITRDDSRHLVILPGSDAPDAIKDAGKAIGLVLNQDQEKEYKMSDLEIGEVMNTECQRDNQMQFCRRLGITTQSICQDRCCLESCKYFAKQYPSCVKKCVNE